MLTVTVIGARGFVGSAFVRQLKNAESFHVREVTRDTYAELAGKPSDVVIDASGNSKKFLAEKDPAQDFELSVTHRLRTLKDFPSEYHLHISSVDVYSDLASTTTTSESATIDQARQSHYGFNKLLAEQLVRHHARRWLILRLAGMVGEGLRKNPVFDILHDQPVFIHPESRYQFMLTDEVATTALLLLDRGISGEIFNVCGDGLISPAEIAALARRTLKLAPEAQAGKARVLDINVEKIKKVTAVSSTRACMERFLNPPA